MTDQPSGFMPDDYDRELARLDRVQGVARTRPAMIRHIPLLGVGGTATYSVTTCREEGDAIDTDDAGKVLKRKPASFTVFLEVGKGERLQRIMIPHSVVTVIVRQRDALNSQVQKRAAKQAAATRKARGIKPTFGRRK
jgi:hypothetical protein